MKPAACFILLVAFTSAIEKRSYYPDIPDETPSSTPSTVPGNVTIPTGTGVSSTSSSVSSGSPTYSTTSTVLPPVTTTPVNTSGSTTKCADTDPVEPIVTSLTCKDRIYGYYADPIDCNIFAICNPTKHPDGTIEILQYNERCPKGTVFNQMRLTCTLPEEAPPCNKVADWYSVNEQFGVLPPNCTTV